MKFFIKVMSGTVVAFTTFVMTLSIIIPLSVSDFEEMRQMSSLFQVAEGIHYQTIFQGFFAAFLVALINAILEEPRVLKGMLYIWKAVLRILLSLFATIVCILVFRWFPIDHLMAWISFFITFGICMTCATWIMVYKTRKENEVYQQLFEEYKRNHSGGEAS